MTETLTALCSWPDHFHADPPRWGKSQPGAGRRRGRGQGPGVGVAMGMDAKPLKCDNKQGTE